jgi:acyl-[acyl-carrier-protein]-phospholipid O-acyltransferase/long-chain-fatty-acid--[acyl-carrier-protein] ligase
MITKIFNRLNRFSSFTYLNITQFLGALNDNMYKLLIVYFMIQAEGIENSPTILASTGAIFVLPFLIFASWAGTLADRFSKSRIIVISKILELIIMCLGLVAFIYGSKIGSYCVLFLMAAQSVLMSPSKYGILPEMMPKEKISKANGLMTSFTYLAIILGTFLASFLVDVTGRHFIISSAFCVGFSVIGLFTSLFIEKTPPSGSQKKLNPRLVYEVYETLKAVKNEPSLIAAVLGSAFFLFIAAYVQLNIIPFAVQSLHLTDVQGGYLFLLTALGIGSGSILAGKISGTTVELGLVPLAGAGISICFFLLDSFSNDLSVAIPLIVTIGVFGGMYLVPLDSYVQITSPKKFIGQVVASSTFLSFVGVLCASGLLYLVSEILGFKADKGFTILGVLTLIVVFIYTYLFFDYLTRFVGMILSRLHFSITFEGQENIPSSPAVYICTHTAWNDTLLLLGAQRRRLRFFIENEKSHSKWLLRLYRLLRVVLIPEIEPLEHNAECLMAIRNTLNRGVSVCIFIDHTDVSDEYTKLKQSKIVQEILQDPNYPMILVRIDKGEKNKKVRFFKWLVNKLHIPATVSFEQVDWSSPESQAMKSKNKATGIPFASDNNVQKPKLPRKGFQPT